MRESGVLLPISSLPSKYGIGCFSKEAYAFIRQLRLAKQKYWQILPLGPTSYGDSPYQSFSAYAGNPYFIDLEDLITQGLLTEKECESCISEEENSYIDYERLSLTRYKILRQSFQRFDCQNEQYQTYVSEEREWLDNYALFMAVKDYHGGISWNLWEDSIKCKKPEAVKRYREECEEDIRFYCFLQFQFSTQWKKLKAYANEQGIKIIGDIPIYVALDSADSWGNKELFQFTEDGLPIAVAGCPPDAFSNTGQLWGNPLYNWDYHKSTDYDWWTKRIAHNFRLYDVVRVDHFRGFDEFYSIPYGHATAEYGSWVKGPGYDLFETLLHKLGKLDIIAEDLGFLTPSVIELVKQTGFPGMKILQFAFSAGEDSSYLPHNYEKNCIVYPGTHDNDTLLGWYQKLSYEDKKFADAYVDIDHVTEKEIPWKFIQLAMRSTANLCIIPVQDYLCLGSEARINTPSTIGQNWTWRMKDGEFSIELCEKIKEITETFRR